MAKQGMKLSSQDSKPLSSLINARLMTCYISRKADLPLSKLCVVRARNQSGQPPAHLSKQTWALKMHDAVA
ncbi:uncharacterized protein MYCFIDRAFT_177958 [Pseudocercospora fijiensis CIRAD86]|uniref:Uncharacterized protein n=1 Tax=Pseudocercospora fijiensis (strain CIRAD86) TaxID=383855 RepID=M3AQJ2_PSEFD|nr:uncharacterized protein MYCFIDRAFT_177958 [Pseudocercospora fijiensis CIRAD86]EME79353.1 hypothetical protein MYCFIDRAFT_177958 [Pseudocercospora fijiensis CIRAD86]